MSRRPDVLSTRALNRALLARQLLLRRSARTPAEVIEHLVGLQAQVPNSPYLALWTRLRRFRHDELTQLLLRRRVVRLALMRSTIHLVTARDALVLRPLVQPVLTRALRGSFGRLLAGIDQDALARAARAIVDEEPRTLNDVGARLRGRWRGRDPFALGHAARAFVPLVQVPPRGVWGDAGTPALASIEQWLGRRLAARPSIDKIVLRYLAAFGPASVRDAQVWSGLTALGEAFDRLRPHLRAFRSDGGPELFDLPGAPRPHADVAAPPRFLPEFDNVLLSHVDRSRIVPEAHRRAVFASAGLMAGTVLLDGFVGARWPLKRTRRETTLTIAPWAALAAHDRAEALTEGERFLAFIDPSAASHDVRIVRGAFPKP